MPVRQWTPRRMVLLAVCVVVLYSLTRLVRPLLPASHTDLVAIQPQSLLHMAAVKLPPIAQGKRMDVQHEYGLDAGTFTTTTTFPLHGNPHQRGIHFRLLNAGVVNTPAFLEADAMLLVVVFTDRNSWGPDRHVDAFFAMLANASIPTASLSLTFLTSNMDEFNAVREKVYDHSSDYAQISLIFRNDFKMARSGTAARYQMLARYRNFALLSTLQEWHQHVVYVDADVYAMPTDLLLKMARADRDIIVPLCVKASDVSSSKMQFDAKAFVNHKRQWRAFASGGEDQPSVQYPLSSFRDSATHEWIPLDSVGAKFIYVRADVHRQGVMFPFHNARGKTDGELEASGLCFAAHVVGYTCWGMPQERVYHHYSDIERWW